MNLYLITACVIGIALDFIFGDPRRMPHIVKTIGSSISKGETLVVGILGRSILSGIILWASVVALFVVSYLILSQFLFAINPWMKVSFDALIVFQCIAFKDLVKHVRAVKNALHQNIKLARKRVSWIVGRDTNHMDSSDVCRATIESGSENLNDAVIAPLFWFALFGPLGALIFRVANTLDAMVGHRNERYENLGKASARIDDLLNFIPARLCCLLILGRRNALNWRSLHSDAVKHPSFNAGWPEAAMAKRLGVVIGGRMYENGQLVQTAEMNAGARQPDPSDIERSVHIMLRAYLTAIVFCFVVIILPLPWQ
jgi:adenosylcobinamide-phosphate synthase